jgi:MFS family permease
LHNILIAWTNNSKDYITYVFGMAGLTGDINLIASSIQYVINVLMTIPALIYMDRWGRRPMFVFGAILMSVWMFTNAGLMASYGHAAPPGGLNNVAEQSWEITGAPSRAVIACTYLFVASYAPTWGPASWVYPPEIFPLRVRGKAVALTYVSPFNSSYFVTNFEFQHLI